MKPNVLTPTELSIIKAVEFVVFLALSAAVTVAYPMISAGTINWSNVAFSGLAVFLLVVIFVIIEYLKQIIQQKLVAAEKAGQSTIQLQDQLAIVTAMEASIGLIAEHTKSIAVLVPNITSLINTAQQTATSALQQQAQQAQDASTKVNIPVSTFDYAVDQVSSSTGAVPVVTNNTTPQ